MYIQLYSTEHLVRDKKVGKPACPLRIQSRIDGPPRVYGGKDMGNWGYFTPMSGVITLLIAIETIQSKKLKAFPSWVIRWATPLML